MSAADLDTVRYARHLLLPELGKSGQERLLAVDVHADEGADRGALAVATEYLTRAGVTLRPRGPDDGVLLAVPGTSEVEALAGLPELVEAARALSGALAAVECIKGVLGLGEPCTVAPSPLSSEEA